MCWGTRYGLEEDTCPIKTAHFALDLGVKSFWRIEREISFGSLDLGRSRSTVEREHDGTTCSVVGLGDSISYFVAKRNFNVRGEIFLGGVKMVGSTRAVGLGKRTAEINCRGNGVQKDLIGRVPLH